MSNSSTKQNETSGSKTLEFNYVGYEYDEIREFSFSWKETNSKDELKEAQDFSTRQIKGIGKKGSEKSIDFAYHVLLKSLIKTEVKNRNNSVDNKKFYIECGNYRKTRKEPISVFFEGEKQEVSDHTEYSKINGLLGAITVEYDSVEFPELDYNKCEINDNYDKLRVNIYLYSRLDKLDVSKESDQGLQDPNPFFTATLLTGGSVDRFNDSVHFNTDNLFDFLLIDILGKRIKEAYKKGIFRSYRQFYGNNERPRGSIDIARHIKFNAGQQNGRIAYTYRENTANNYLNILILKAYEYCKKKYPEVVRVKIDNDKNLKDFFRELSVDAKASEVSVHWAVTKNIRPISHPYYNEYEEVRKICLRIFRNEGVSIFSADKGEVSGYVYYSPDLWEDCLKTIFMRVASRSFDVIKVEDQESQGFLSKGEPDKYFCESRPDFVFKNSLTDKCELVLDAKLIPNMEYFFDDKKSGYIQSNFGGAIDKAIRDMEVWGAKGTGLVFPIGVKDCFENNTDEDSLKKNEEVKEHIIEKYYGEKFCISMRSMGDISERAFGIIPFLIPYSRDYTQYSIWKKQYYQFEKIFTENLIVVFERTFCENNNAD